MNKNIKIARELIKIAKSLVSKRFSADNEEDLKFCQDQIKGMINAMNNGDRDTLESLFDKINLDDLSLSTYFHEKIEFFLERVRRIYSFPKVVRNGFYVFP